MMFSPLRFPPTPIVFAFFAVGIAIAGLVPTVADAEGATYACADKGTRLPHPLTHMAQRIAAGKPLTIVALGSSSTAGAGASGPAA